MYLDYTKIEFDQYGRPETPELLLKTKAGQSIGVLSNVTDLKINIKFSEPSELTFDIAAYSDGAATPYYDDIVGYKVIWTKNYGVYIIMNPEISGDGIEETKSIKAYSIEKELEQKKFFLEEGTFNFWNPTDVADTIIGRILEIAQGWSVGYVSPTLAGRYRTFDQADDYLLDFIYNTLPDKFRCVFVFDPYLKTINVYDVDEDRPTLPIYLDFDNLVQSLDVEEKSDELITALSPYGSDDLDIRAVNPLGTNWIYDLSYFISNGDIPEDIATKWESWQNSILSNQAYYNGLVSLEASATAQLLTLKSKLVDLQGELEDLTNQQSVTIQALAMETTDEGKKTQQDLLDEINEKIEDKNAEISALQSDISEVENKLGDENEESYTSQIKAINEALSISNFFTDEEYSVIRQYFIEQDLVEETFVATNIDTTISGSTSTMSDGSIEITGAKITQVDLNEQLQKDIYSISGGAFSVDGNSVVTGDIIRATLERNTDGSFVMSIYAGTLKSEDTTAPSGLITLTGTLSDYQDDIASVTENEVTTLEGSSMSFSIPDASIYMTANAGDYQKYSVAMELYDFAVETLSDVATPTYEFDLDTANFIFAQEFKQFRDKLELGKGVYVRLHDGRVIQPTLIEFELDFENREDLSLVFSTNFKRNDNINTLKDMIDKSYSTSRRFEANKFIYNQTADQASSVSRFMSSSLDAAVNEIIGAKNQSVVINGAGIQIGGDSPYKIRIVDSMIAMSDDDFKTAKVAIGHFASPDVGDYWGVNAEIIGGKLLVGNNLVIENTSDNGVMQFKVDASGAWLYNSTFVLAEDNGGKIILDPKYGIAAGTGNLYTTNGTTVTPSFIDEDENIIFDDDGMPENANFYIDQKTGDVYMRGNVYAEDGVFRGTVYANDGEFTGTVNATDGVFKGTVYADDGEFTGKIHATSGEFSGTIKASVLEGTLTGSQSGGGAIEGVSLNIGNGAFTVDTQGNVVIQKGSISWGAVTGTDDIDNRIDAAQSDANDALSVAGDAADDVYDLARGRYTRGTFISGTKISSPTIEGATIIGGKFCSAQDEDSYIIMNDDGSGRLDFYSSNTSGAPIFSVIDYIGSVRLSAYDEGFLVTQGDQTWAHGDWHFSGTVSGITAQFG